MIACGWLVAAILLAYSCAWVAPWSRDWLGDRLGGVLEWSLVILVFVCPLLIPGVKVGFRAACAVITSDLAFKMIESIRHRRLSGRGIPRRAYTFFLIPFPVFSVVYPEQRRRLAKPGNPGPQVARVLGGGLGVLLALITLRSLSPLSVIRTSFAINHVAMLVTFVIAIESLSRMIDGLEHLAGFDTTPIVRDAYRSRTVAEFWRRYNGRVHRWLELNVFRALGGRLAPARSLLLVFLISGLFHEAAFAMATSQITGYQFAFFTIQGPAVLASGWLERLAHRGGIGGKIMAHVATIGFLAATSVLFFDGVSRVFPFLYASPSP